MIICTVHEDESTCSNHSETPFVPVLEESMVILRSSYFTLENFCIAHFSSLIARNPSVLNACLFSLAVLDILHDVSSNRCQRCTSLSSRSRRIYLHFVVRMALKQLPPLLRGMELSKLPKMPIHLQPVLRPLLLVVLLVAARAMLLVCVLGYTPLPQNLGGALPNACIFPKYPYLPVYKC